LTNDHQWPILLIVLKEGVIKMTEKQILILLKQPKIDKNQLLISGIKRIINEENI